MRKENTKKAPLCAANTQFELSKDVLNKLYKFNLKPVTKLVLLYLCDCYNPKNACMFPKQKTIAAKLGVSEASVIRAIQELHKEGLIITERKYTNIYKFTSKIASQPLEIKQKNKLVNNSQNAIKETCNLQGVYIEQKKVTNNTTNVEDFKILRDYAVKHGAKNINAYINALKKSGSDKDILKEYKAIKNRAKNEERKNKELLAYYREIKQNSEPPTEAWKLLGEKIKKMRKG